MIVVVGELICIIWSFDHYFREDDIVLTKVFCSVNTVTTLPQVTNSQKAVRKQDNRLSQTYGSLQREKLTIQRERHWGHVPNVSKIKLTSILHQNEP